jgi:hypothetical protein
MYLIKASLFFLEIGETHVLKKYSISIHRAGLIGEQVKLVQISAIPARFTLCRVKAKFSSNSVQEMPS